MAESKKQNSLTGSLADHRLDCEGVPFLHDAVRLVVLVVQDVGVRGCSL